MSSPLDPAKLGRLGVLICLLAWLTVPCVAAEPVVTATSIPVGQRPLIDGKLHDACWQQGDWQTDFRLLHKNAAAAHQTCFRVLHDEDNLYLGVECMEPDMGQLKEVRGGGIFRGESIEVFLDINRDGQTYYHLMTNTLGVCEGRAEGRELVWSASAHKAKDRWTTEMVIPFSSFAIGPEVGPTWRLNICRQRYATERELSTWARLGPMGGFHQPKHFGELRGLNVDFSRFRYALGEPQVRTKVEGRALHVRFELPVENASGKAVELRLEGSLMPPAGKPQSCDTKLALDPSGALCATLGAYTVTQSGDYKLLVALTDPTAGRVHYRTRFPVRLYYTPLAIRMVQPCYRDTIFATQKLDKVQLLVEMGLDEAELKKSALTVQLSAAGSAQPLQTRQIAPVQATSVPVTLDATKLSVGDYVIAARLVDSKGREVAAAERALHKLPPAPGSEVRLDEHNNTVVNGVPTLVYGYFSVGPGTYPGREFKGMEQSAADGCTALLEYGEPYWSKESGNHYLDTARKIGLSVVVGPYYRVFHRQGGLPKVGAPDPSLPEKMRQGIAERVLLWKDHPAFLAWYLADEPDCNNWSPAALQEVYELVRGLDPYHPCIVLCKGASTHHAVRKCADIFMPDPYIHPRLDGKFNTPLTVFRTYFETIAQEGKAPWITPQAFGSGYRNESLMCEPSFEHMRAMAYMAFAHKCKGVLYYAWGYLTLFPASYHGARFLSREVAALTPVLLAPDSDVQAKVKPDGAEVDVLVMEYKGDIYIIAVNTQFAEVDASFEVPGLAGRRLAAIFEDRKLMPKADAFADHFGKYGVHVYTTAAQPPSLGKTVQQVRAEAAAIRAARLKEGNLALRMTKDGKLTGVNIDWQQGAHSIDGYTDLFTAYKWNARPKPPTNLTVTFPRTETVARVVVYTPQVKDYEIQVADGADWRTVATVSDNAERVVTTRFEPVTTDKLRLHITAVHPPEWEKERYGFAAHGAIVDEVEVYRH